MAGLVQRAETNLNKLTCTGSMENLAGVQGNQSCVGELQKIPFLYSMNLVLRFFATAFYSKEKYHAK